MTNTRALFVLYFPPVIRLIVFLPVGTNKLPTVWFLFLFFAPVVSILTS